MLGQLFLRDIRLAMRRPGEVISDIGYFLMIATLFPLAVGPAPDKLAIITSAILWIAVLLAALPSFDRLYVDDEASGFLDRIIVSRTPLSGYVLVRIASHFLVMGGPLLLTVPVLALFFAIAPYHLPIMLVIMAAGLAALTCLGSIGAALTLGARRSGLLSAILILPLSFPLLIFGTLATEALLTGGAYHAHFYLLLSSCLFLIVLSPIASVFALRIAIEER